MKTKLTLIALIILAAALVGCSRDIDEANTGALSLVSVGSTNGTEGLSEVTLWAGQDIYAGTVSVRIEDDDSVQGNEQICITYNTAGGWELVETHVWFGGKIANMPQTKKGNPKIGNFPHASGDITGATTWEICIPLNEWGNEGGTDGYEDLCGQVLYAAAHAALQLNDGSGNIIQTETGWADGDDTTTGRSWATYFSVELTCDGMYPPRLDGCETAFAYGCLDYANCFITLDELIDGEDPLPARWGWTNGPLAAGTYEFDIYAGAGQCDLEKGTLVGMLTVDHVGTTATVTYSTYEGFVMEEIHLYVGNELLPRDNQGDFTVAPGLLGHTMEFGDPVTDYTYTVENLILGDPIYVVAHAVVCGDYDTMWGYEAVCDPPCVPGFDYSGFEAALEAVEGTDGLVTLNVVHQSGSEFQPYFIGSLDDPDKTGLPFYCVDLDNTIYSNRDYCATLYSTYDDDIPVDLNHPETLDQVNYLLNTYSIGDLATIDGKAFTGGDFQRAIWFLVHGGALQAAGAYTSGLSSDDRVNELLDAAAYNGVNFEPPCSGVVGVIVFPESCSGDETGQTLIAQMLVTEFEAICTVCP